VRYLGIAFLIGLLLACGTPSAVQPTPRPASQEPTIAAAPADTEVLAALATDAPTVELATAEAQTTSPPAPEAPTSAPRVTFTPAPTIPPALGAAPSGSDCPADHPVKGNIVDRGANKGEKIYHLPGDNGYAQTNPERCFVDSKEAEAAGFRAVKK